MEREICGAVERGEGLWWSVRVVIGAWIMLAGRGGGCMEGWPVFRAPSLKLQWWWLWMVVL